LAALSGLGVLAFSLALGEVFLGDVFSGLSGDILTCFTGDSFFGDYNLKKNMVLIIYFI
jgi:hypothetical protein